MNPSRPLRVERLDAGHNLGAFDSGNDQLDCWLRRHAVAGQHMDSARTFVVTGGTELIGYFSLTMGSVRRADAPAKLVQGLPAYPVGMVLLARLAVDRREQSQGIGAAVLAEALRKAVTAGEAAAARLLVVDAIDDTAAAIYRHHGFIPAPEQALRHYRRLKDIRASLPMITS